VRRISNPRIKKPSAKAQPAAEAPPAAPNDPAPGAEPVDSGTIAAPVAAAPAPAEVPASVEPPAPVVDAPVATASATEGEFDDSPAPGDDWPEPDAPTTPGQDSKRKRRRRKGKGQGQSSNGQGQGPHGQSGIAPVVEETHAVADPALATVGDGPRPQRPPHNPPSGQPRQRPKIDPETLGNKAWKIYLAEVSEEGVALIGDQDARELARRCFRLAEIFIEEQTRRLST
jgi:hypothetical protein